MLHLPVLLLILLAISTLITASAPHDFRVLPHRQVRSRRSRAGAPLLSRRQSTRSGVSDSDAQCSLAMSSTDAAQWSAFLGAGMLECTASATDLEEGIAMCYRLGFVNTEEGTFGGELTVWRVEGTKGRDNVTASIIASSAAADATPTSSQSASASVSGTRNSTSSSLSDGNSTSVSFDPSTSTPTSVSADASTATETGRLRRRAKQSRQAISITMEIAGLQYRTGSFVLSTEQKARGRSEAAAAAVAKDGQGQAGVLDIANVKFAARGMQLIQSFHFVGPLERTKGGKEKRAPQEGVNLDLSFDAVLRGNSSSSESSFWSSRASRTSSPTSFSSVTAATATNNSTRATPSPSATIRNSTTSLPFPASLLRALSPRMQVIASSSLAGNLSKPVMLDLSQENARADGFARRAFGVFAILLQAEGERGSGREIGLVADRECAIVIDEKANSTLPATVFSKVHVGPFFSSAASETASLTSTAAVSSSTSTGVTSSSSANTTTVSSSATITSSAFVSSSSVLGSSSSIASGNPSSGPNARLFSTGQIAASDAANISPSSSPTAAATPTTTQEPEAEATPTPSPTQQDEEPSSSSSSLGDANATAAQAEAADPSATAFQLPGRSISVLPIGLGVFGGISAVALAIVGWVTYERRKYKKQFTKRTAAVAQGRRSGYGTV